MVSRRWTSWWCLAGGLAGGGLAGGGLAGGGLAGGRPMYDLANAGPRSCRRRAGAETCRDDWCAVTIRKLPIYF